MTCAHNGGQDPVKECHGNDKASKPACLQVSNRRSLRHCSWAMIKSAEAEEKGKERIWNKLHLHAEQFSSAYRGVACSGILKLVSSSLFFNIDTQTGAHDVLSASHLIKKERKIEGRLYNYHHLGLWAACRMCVVCWQYLHGSSGKGMHAGARALGFTFDCILCCPTLCPMRSQSCTVQR